MNADYALYQLHKRQRDIAAMLRFAKPDPRQILARAVERELVRQIAALGYSAHLTTPGARCDILVADTCRVEVKASTWQNRPDRDAGGYYQFFYHNRADLLIACCVNGSNHHFIIPVQDLGDRRNIRIHSHDPADHIGQWSPYLENWTHLHQVVEHTQSRPAQRSFLQ